MTLIPRIFDTGGLIPGALDQGPMIADERATHVDAAGLVGVQPVLVREYIQRASDRRQRFRGVLLDRALDLRHDLLLGPSAAQVHVYVSY